MGIHSNSIQSKLDFAFMHLNVLHLLLYLEISVQTFGGQFDTLMSSKVVWWVD